MHISSFSVITSGNKLPGYIWQKYCHLSHRESQCFKRSHEPADILYGTNSRGKTAVPGEWCKTRSKPTNQVTSAQRQHLLSCHYLPATWESQYKLRTVSWQLKESWPTTSLSASSLCSGTQPLSSPAWEQLSRAETADGNPGWSRARLDHFPIPGRADRTDLQVKKVGRNKRHKEHEEIGGRTDKSGKVFTEESSLPRGSNQTKTTPKKHL